MNNESYLNEFIKECAAAKPKTPDEKFIGWENTIYILVGFGLKLLLPELKEWLKMGAMVVTMKRLEIKKRLLDYAKEKEIEFQEAEQAAGVIVEKIDENNIGKLIADLEKAGDSK